MAKSKLCLKLNRKGVRELLKSDEIENVCREFAVKSMDKLGKGYEATAIKGTNRAVASVKAVTRTAKKKNREENTILKAVLGSHD